MIAYVVLIPVKAQIALQAIYTWSAPYFLEYGAVFIPR